MNRIAAQIENLRSGLKPFQRVELKSSTLPAMEQYLSEYNNESERPPEPSKMNRYQTFSAVRRRGKKGLARPKILRQTLPLHGQKETLIALRAILDYYESVGIETTPFNAMELGTSDGLSNFFSPLYRLNIPGIEWSLEGFSLTEEGFSIYLPHFELADELGSEVEQSFVSGHEYVASLLEKILTETDDYSQSFEDSLVIKLEDKELIAKVGIQDILRSYDQNYTEDHWYNFMELENVEAFFAPVAEKYPDFNLDGVYIFTDCPDYVEIKSANDIQLVVDIWHCFENLSEKIPDSWNFLGNINNTIGAHINHFCEAWRQLHKEEI